ncbi:MAG: hypothetical protein E5X74_31035 [Mesorhizobium sp.]|uniref:hypothetical protein n=1 Tax=Mesorhizobium sp. TaxID=1871066 RepID=UPI001211A4FE|nr:hypothetical protein [Mesorhizobium sp.]TIO72919.1 MAG: hypothetical protein E5X75_30680 [Mesorhizobium sp.]TIO80888.1 MAG: hypothetical protein E5X74_31035 [Mesorhizobium sp.]
MTAKSGAMRGNFGRLQPHDSLWRLPLRLAGPLAAGVRFAGDDPVTVTKNVDSSTKNAEMGFGCVGKAAARPLIDWSPAANDR